MARSDEQLAYYVAQAREIIDLSIMSQKGIVDQIAHLPVKKALVDREVIL
jgi:Holliday junction resolvasome RuvABC endonuclease subunit